MGSTIVIVLLCCVTILAIFFGFYAIRFGIILLRVQDQIEESLDTLDTQHTIISEILERPVYSDSFEIREIVKCIDASRASILSVANKLVEHSSNKESDQIEKD